jgi:hypothetical protein
VLRAATPAPSLRGHASVETWAGALRRQWGGDPLAEDPEKLETLGAFCDFTGLDPDELVAFCFLRRRATGERFASVRRREELMERLRAFRDARRLSGIAGRRLVASVLSFLIHNGVLVNAAAV